MEYGSANHQKQWRTSKQLYPQDIQANTANRLVSVANRKRNFKLSELLTLVITFTQKIQRLKQKLCGFPCSCFSPQVFYRILDKSLKGYVSLEDMSKFIKNSKVTQNDIAQLFGRVNEGSAEGGKLTYFGYLNLLKPYFHQELAKDFLRRDALTRQQIASLPPNQQAHNEQVLKIFHDLLLMQCICAAEHRTIKQKIMEEYMLNAFELQEILGLNPIKGSLVALYEFVRDNSSYELRFPQMRNLLAFLNTYEAMLASQKYISLLYLPIANQLRIEPARKQRDSEPLLGCKERYNRSYLTKHDLIDQNFVYCPDKQSPYSFLGYVHNNDKKNSYKPQTVFTQKEVAIPNPPRKFYASASKGLYSHKKEADLPLSFNRQNLSVSKRQEHQKSNRSPLLQNYKPYPDSNRMHIQSGYSSQKAQYHNFETPLLEQFMKESQIALNMSRAKMGSEHSQQAFLRIGDSGVKASRAWYPQVEHREWAPNSVFDTHVDRSSFIQEVSQKKQEGCGVLDGFLKIC